MSWQREIQPGERVLHIGCGKKKIPGSVGVDFCEGSDADVIWDLDKTPWPFEDNEFDRVVCEHVIEHVGNYLGVIDEIYRVTQNGGLLMVEVPYFTSVFSFSDPTHRRAFTSRSFDYFVEGYEVHEFEYAKALFKKREVRVLPDDGGWLTRIVMNLINRHIDFYEQRFAFWFPRHTIRYVLEVVKKDARIERA
jgi:SAM-dependent methyltransferase